MLSLAYAATHPAQVESLVLIGCGTFDLSAREHVNTILDERMDDGLRQQLEQLPKEYPDDDKRLSMMGKLIMPLYAYDLLPDESIKVDCDAPCTLGNLGGHVALAA